MTFYTISKAFAASVLAFSLSNSVQADTTEDFRAATTVAAIAKLGAKQMDGGSIQKIFSGRTLKNPNWTWKLRRNGVQTSKADDGSWTDKGTWEVRGNQFCRQSELSKGKELCSDIYFLGRDLKFSKSGSPKKLTEWFVSY